MMMKTDTLSLDNKQKLENLSIFLKELRRNFGYRQSDVSNDLNIHRNTIGRIENANNFTIKHLLELAEYYGIPAHELLQEAE